MDESINQQEIQKDLELLEQVEFKFALSDTPDKLQNFLNGLLAPTLRKGATKYPQVQTKVVQVLTPILKLLNLASTTVLIPASSLATLIYEDGMNLVSQNLSLKFLEVGYTKLNYNEQAQLIPLLLKDISKLDSPTLSKALIRLVILLIPSANKVVDLKENAELNIFQSLPEFSLNYILDRLFNFVLHGWSKLDIQPNTTGLNFKQLQYEVMKYISKPLDDKVKWPLKAYQVLLAGTVSTYRDNVEVAETTLKRVERPDVEDEGVIKIYLAMYLAKDAPIPLKVKLMDQFLRSRLVTTLPHFIHTIFDGINGVSSDSKLKARSLQGMQWLIRQRDKKYIDGISQILLAGLDKTFNQDIYSDASREEFSIYGSCCLTVGILASKAPRIFRQNLDPLIKLLNCLNYEPIVPQVRDGLNIMLEGYKDIFNTTSSHDNFSTQMFEHLNATYHDENPVKRSMALHYLIAIYPYYHLPSRYLCVLGSGDKDPSIRDLAKTGLEVEFPEDYDPHPISPLQILEYAKDDSTLGAQVPSYLAPQDGASLIEGFPTVTLDYMLKFVWSLIVQVPLSQLRFSSGTDASTNTHLERVRDVVRLEFEDISLNDSELISKRMRIFVQYLIASLTTPSHNSNLSTTSAYILSQLTSCAPPDLLEHLKTYLNLFGDLTLNGSDETKDWMARTYAVVMVSTINSSESDPFQAIQPTIDHLLHILNTKSFDTKMFSSAARALSYILGRFHYRFPSHRWNPKAVDCLVAILSLIQSRQAAHLTALCLALQEIGRYSPLPDLEGLLELPKGVATDELVPLAILKYIIKTTPSTKVAENALLTLGHLSVGDTQYREPSIQLLLDLPYPLNKNVEVFFRSGEAIACLLGRWDCSLMRPYLDLPPHTPPHIETSDVDNLPTMLSTLTDAANSPTPNIRKGAAFCLLAIVQFCTQLEQLQPHYPKLHQIFLSLLADKDDLVQEVASTGMSLVFDNASETTKKQLTNEVVNMFIQGKSLAETRKGDNPVLFEANELGSTTSTSNRNGSNSSTPDTSQLTTYKSIMGLAADMNQPELIYQFLALARSNAIWSSRKGAAFGLAHLLKNTKVEIDPMLPKLVPQLYRFKYDTDPKVASAMHSIWDALLPVQHKKARVSEDLEPDTNARPDTSNLLDTYFDVIVVDLLKNVGDRSWRTRQASCSALADLLSGRKGVNLAPYMAQIWLMAFRALDDIKESVREAGLKCCRSVMSVTVKFVNPDHKPLSQGVSILQTVVPFLLEKGIQSDAEDVRKFSLNAILSIVTTSKHLIQPYAAKLIDTLLDSLTQFEPKELNYLTFHTDKLEVTKQELEQMRLSALIQSPINVALTAIVSHTKDAKTVAEVVQELTVKIRKSPGLPTKFGTAKLLVNLITSYPDLIKLHATKLLKVAVLPLNDPSSTVRQLFASAIGQLAPLTQPQAISDLLEKILNEYLESQDVHKRSVASSTTLEVVNRIDRATVRNVPNLLPIAFYGSFDPDQSTANKWDELWRDNTTGTSAAILSHQVQILELVVNRFNSSSWSHKIQAAKTLAKATTILNTNINEGWYTSSFNLIFEQLQGRVWDGKENLLDTLADIVATCINYLNEDSERIEKIATTILKSLKKNSLVFKSKAIAITTRILPILKGKLVETHPQIIELLKPIVIEDEVNDDGNTETDHLKPRHLVVKSLAVTCWITTVATTLPHLTTEATANHLKELAEGYKTLNSQVWNVKLNAIQATTVLLDPLLLLTSEQLTEVPAAFWISMTNFLESALQDFKYLQIRLLATDCTLKLSKVDSPFVKDSLKRLKELGVKDPNTQVSDRFKELQI